MVEVYRPEQRSTLSKFVGLFQQGASLMKDGKEAYEGGKNLWDKFTGGGSGGSGGGLGAGEAAAGGAAGKYGLGLKFGNVTAAEGAGQSASLGEAAASVAPYIAPAAAAYGTYQDYKETGGANAGPIGTSPNSQKTRWTAAENTLKAGRDINSEFNRVTSGLSLTEEKAKKSDASPDKMSAIERRYSSQQTAQKDIEEAQKALDMAGLPVDERRSIAQKLERARQQLTSGGRKRGSTSYT